MLMSIDYSMFGHIALPVNLSAMVRIPVPTFVASCTTALPAVTSASASSMLFPAVFKAEAED